MNEQRKRSKAAKMILVLIIVIIVLAGYILYVQAVKPGIDQYVAEKQIEALNLLIAQVQQNGQIQFLDIDEQGNDVICYLDQLQAQAAA